MRCREPEGEAGWGVWTWSGWKPASMNGGRVPGWAAGRVTSVEAAWAASPVGRSVGILLLWPLRQAGRRVSAVRSAVSHAGPWCPVPSREHPV